MPDAAGGSSKAQFALKTALSLTLAYMLPMALGWPQPQTAAITVMLIAATGMVSESLQKGVLRVMGTVVGAVIGLTLIALFPQDRILYLFSVSVAVASLLYLYNAYQGDSTLFMLAAVVTLMVFNGGNAEGAFLYGVERTLLTAFGVLVYTLVASLLWPVKVQDRTRKLAAAVSAAHHQAFTQLLSPGAPEPGAIEKVLTRNEQFQAHLVTVRNDEEGILRYEKEWNTIANSFELLDELLLPALHSPSVADSQYRQYIPDHDAVVANIKALMAAVEASWSGEADVQPMIAIELVFDHGRLERESHLEAAAIIARADLLKRLQDVLLNLWRTTSSLLYDGSGFTPLLGLRSKPNFIWFDLENFKTAIRVFVTFWLAATVWIIFNPPGGFIFVTFSTVLVVLVSYTALPPKLLYILFSLGFAFAVPAYIFLLPQLTHWLELAAFIFTYAFIGFYIFSGPLSIFFLLGLITLGIQNTMSYQFDVILILVLLFYLTCTSLVVTVYFPFTSKPNLLFISARRRFFRNCEKVLRYSAGPHRFGHQRLLNLHLVGAKALCAKLHQWGDRIDSARFPANPPDKIAAFTFACTVLLEQLKILARRNESFSRNKLTDRARNGDNSTMLASLCRALAEADSVDQLDGPFLAVEQTLGNVENSLSVLLGDNYLATSRAEELTEFYLYIHLQASIYAGIVQCRDAVQALDWQQLQDKTF